MTTIKKMMAALPNIYRKITVTKLSNNFREATELQKVDFPSNIKDDHIVIRNRYSGINASDVNVANGLGGYTDSPPPFNVGFESIGEIAMLGNGVKNLKVGQPVAAMTLGSHGEYQELPAKFAIPLPDVKPEYLALMASAMTADMAYQECGPLKAGQSVLVTAAAGGTGQFAVQLAKLAGCHVIGTCSTDEKVEFLKTLGCDRPINYKKENLKSVLKNEYKKGVDVIYESVGGDIFDTCFNALAIYGKVIVIGAISSYSFDAKVHNSPVLPRLPLTLLMKSASIHGFFLFRYAHKYRESMMRLMQLYGSGQLHVAMDNGKNSPTGHFQTLESVYDAIDYMYSGRNEGKIYVKIGESSKL
ncbi:prostaglandin reductase-3-like [Apostichopus japonicus]|uniref:prostaglandin reductase-3-like n=1 Tax=Stichopus japonicus TaxID=307972 RepID=UPI003AB6A913